MFRTVLTLFALILFFIIVFPIMLILLVLRLFNPMLASKIGQPIVGGFGFRFVLWATGCKCQVTGTENIPKDEAVMFAANHRGLLDAAIAYYAVPYSKVTSFVAKRETKKVIFLNWWMMILGCIFIDRSSPKAGLESIKLAIEHIKNGRSIFIMPAGTRTQDEGVGEFKGGSFKISERTRCPIVPVAIAHSDDAFDNHIPKMKPCRLAIKFGEPVYTKDLSRDEFRDIPEVVKGKVLELYNEIK